MPVYRVLMGFAGRSQGWSEQHLLSSPLANPRDLDGIVVQLCQKRAELLGNPYTIVARRISKYLKNDGTRDDRGSFFLRGVFAPTAQSGSGDAEPADVALLMRGSSNTVPNENTTPLGAPSDAAVTNGGQVIPAGGNLAPNFASYATFLTTANPQWGWGGSIILFDGAIDSITNNNNGTITFNMVAPHGQPVAALPLYPARVRRVNQGASPLNGGLIVVATGPSQLTTTEIIGTATPQTGGFLKLYKPVRGFIKYDNIDLENIVGNHKRGRPFGSSPGRAKRRIRG